jgi:hypothetical protein
MGPGSSFRNSSLAPVIVLRLVLDMQVNAEIHLGTRSVLEYLHSPVQKVA